MRIADDFERIDDVSGLKLFVLAGTKLDRLRVENRRTGEVRDFWFDKEGRFDGTGSLLRTAPPESQP